jgi:hypothetical protein
MGKHGHHPPSSPYIQLITKRVVSVLINLSVYSQRMRAKKEINEGRTPCLYRRGRIGNDHRGVRGEGRAVSEAGLARV